MPSHWYGIHAAIFSVGAQFVLFLRWMHRRMRNDEIMRAFVRDIATNHLQHIYDALHKIAARQGITSTKRPWSASWTSTAIATVDSTGKSIVIPSGAGRLFLPRSFLERVGLRGRGTLRHRAVFAR